ncbi:MAG TPA: serine/threonine-protein kinase [Gemmatimonadales bacterium]
MRERLQAALRDRYRVEREVGAGGMAIVFLATDLKHQRPVAIKVLRPELAAALGHERFLREIEIAAKLQHPHVLPVYDSGQADGMLYYVMPFVEGESLRDRLVRAGPLADPEAARIAREVADALAYAHRQGIVHRDIKPANILLSQGHAMVADFGIARAVTASAAGPGLTQTGMAVGTPRYMSPEQALGETNLDGRTDIYALGVVLYEMLAGHPPFEGSTPQSIIALALSHKVPKLTHDALGVQLVIERALAREPGDRFATADELSAALDGLLSGTAFPGATRRRTRTIFAAAGLGLVAVLALAFWSRGVGAEGDPRKSLIVFPFENKTGDPARGYLGEAAMNLLGLAAAHWEDMRVYDDERTASLMRRHDVPAEGEVDFDAARAMAREARVGTLVLGDVRREGDSLAIEGKVYDVKSGDRLATHVVRAAWNADPRPLFDALAARILGTSGAPPGERPTVLAQTTSSIAAYRAYLAGTAALQRFQIDSAKELLEVAVALDTGFALAYIRLHDAEGWGNPSNERRAQYLAAAERHSVSLPPRLRALVEFHRAYRDGRFPRARRIVEEMIARDSTDVEAWYQLGEAHYHHRSSDFPHPDTLGNLGRALRAFQRTLTLDSSYVLAYQHILDALAACARDVGSGAYRLCLADSAVYATPEALTRTFGTATVARWRGAAREAQVPTARGWAAVVPGTSRPRQMLLRVLYAQQRYDEALEEARAMDRLGWQAEAGFWQGMALFRMGRVGEAATAVHDGLALARDTVAAFQGLDSWSVPSALLAGGGGRRVEAVRLYAALSTGMKLDSTNGPGNLRMAITDLDRLAEWYLGAEVGQLGPRPGRRNGPVDELRATIDRYARGDTVRLRRVLQALGGSCLTMFLVTRDTTLLNLLVTHVDTLNSSTWHVADAHLALARGDTARARMRVEHHYRVPAESEFSGEPGVIRVFAWGDLLARLREAGLALEAYARLDSLEDAIQHPGFVVRSWAERGALHQQLGEKAEAIRQYERFIEAWQDADPELQPFVERAREAVAALRGEARPPTPR